MAVASELKNLYKEGRELLRRRTKLEKDLKEKKRELLFLRIKKYGVVIFFYLAIPFLVLNPAMVLLIPDYVLIVMLIYYITITIALVIWYKKTKE